MSGRIVHVRHVHRALNSDAADRHVAFHFAHVVDQRIGLAAVELFRAASGENRRRAEHELVRHIRAEVEETDPGAVQRHRRATVVRHHHHDLPGPRLPGGHRRLRRPRVLDGQVSRFVHGHRVTQCERFGVRVSVLVTDQRHGGFPGAQSHVGRHGLGPESQRGVARGNADHLGGVQQGVERMHAVGEMETGAVRVEIDGGATAVVHAHGESGIAAAVDLLRGKGTAHVADVGRCLNQDQVGHRVRSRRVDHAVAVVLRRTHSGPDPDRTERVARPGHRVDQLVRAVPFQERRAAAFESRGPLDDVVELLHVAADRVETDVGVRLSNQVRRDAAFAQVLHPDRHRPVGGRVSRQGRVRGLHAHDPDVRRALHRHLTGVGRVGLLRNPVVRIHVASLHPRVDRGHPGEQARLGDRENQRVRFTRGQPCRSAQHPGHGLLHGKIVASAETDPRGVENGVEIRLAVVRHRDLHLPGFVLIGGDRGLARSDTVDHQAGRRLDRNTAVPARNLRIRVNPFRGCHASEDRDLARRRPRFVDLVDKRVLTAVGRHHVAAPGQCSRVGNRVLAGQVRAALAKTDVGLIGVEVDVRRRLAGVLHNNVHFPQLGLAARHLALRRRDAHDRQRGLFPHHHLIVRAAGVGRGSLGIDVVAPHLAVHLHVARLRRRHNIESHVERRPLTTGDRGRVCRIREPNVVGRLVAGLTHEVQVDAVDHSRARLRRAVVVVNGQRGGDSRVALVNRILRHGHAGHEQRRRFQYLPLVCGAGGVVAYRRTTRRAADVAVHRDRSELGGGLDVHAESQRDLTASRDHRDRVRSRDGVVERPVVRTVGEGQTAAHS